MMYCVTAGQTSAGLLDCVFIPQQIGPDKSLGAAAEDIYRVLDLVLAQLTRSTHPQLDSS